MRWKATEVATCLAAAAAAPGALDNSAGLSRQATLTFCGCTVPLNLSKLITQAQIHTRFWFAAVSKLTRVPSSALPSLTWFCRSPDCPQGGSTRQARFCAE